MIDEQVGGGQRRLAAAVIPLLREIGAGMAAAVVSLAYCQSYGALVFSGPLQPHLGQGVAAALVGTAITATMVALFGSLRGVIAGADSNPTALVAAMMAVLAPTLASVPPSQALLLACAAVAASSMLTGAALFLAGWRRLSKFVRFIPYPVVAGFLAGTGWLILAGAVAMATGVRLSLSTVGEFAQPHQLLLLAISLACAAGLVLVTYRFKQPLTLPLVLVAVTIAANIGLHFGLSREAVRESGLMFENTGGGLGLAVLLAEGPGHLDWSVLFSVAGEMVAVAVMSLLCILLNSTSIELAVGTEIDLDHELQVAGAANLLSGLLGGFVGYASLSRTMLNRAIGARGRLSGLVVGLVALAVLIGGGGVMAVLPRFLMGGLLMMIGGRMLWDWVIVSRRRMPLQDWLVVVAIVLLTASAGFLAALVLGIVAACVMFTIDVSRTRIIHHAFGIDERCSSVLRSSEDMELLARYGGQVQVIELTGYIFFGSAYGLQQHVKAMIARRKPICVMFDFASVSGIDSSAGAGFAKINSLLREAGIGQSVSGLRPDMARILGGVGALAGGVRSYTTLDGALEEAEADLLDGLRGAGRERTSLRNWLSEALGSDAHARALVGYLVPAKPASETCLCRQGDDTDSLLFIEHGRVSVMLERAGQAPLRVRVFGDHTIVGEVGFFLDSPRTASLHLEQETIVWALYRPGFDRLKAEQPEIVAALFTYVIRLQSERLAFATRQIAALQR